MQALAGEARAGREEDAAGQSCGWLVKVELVMLAAAAGRNATARCHHR